MKTSLIKKDSLLLLIFLLLMSYVFFIFEDFRIYSIQIIWLGICIYLIKGGFKNIPLLFFMITIFTFIISHFAIPSFVQTDYIISAEENAVSFTKETYDFIYLALYVCIIFSFVGFFSFSQDEHFTVVRNANRLYKIERISVFLFYSTLPFVLFVLIERISFVWNNSYLDYYLNYKQNLPSVVYKLSSFNDVSLFLFLATMPSKKKCIPLIIIYLLLAFASLLMGARSNFMLSLMFCFFYFSIRNVISPNDLWINKKHIIIILFSIPFLLAFMFLIMIWRGGNKLDENVSVFDLMANLIYQQGVSMNVVGMTYEYRSQIPQDKLYSFGELIDNYNKNVFFQILGTAKELRSQTEEYALEGHSLANYLTYQFQTSRFFSGGGMGTSYIAEVWHDFGFVGLAIWSFVYGVILSKFLKLIQKNVWLTTIAFMMFTSIIYAPRGSAIGFIADVFGPFNLLMFLIIYLLTKMNFRII